MSNTDLTQLNSSINTFIKIIKGTVNDKKFDYDDKGFEDAIEYATQLMRDKKPVNFEWHDEYEKEVFIEKLLGLLAVPAALAGSAIGSAAADVADRVIFGSTKESKNTIKPKKKHIRTISKQNNSNTVEIEKILGVLTGLLGSTKASREKIKKDVKKEVNLQKLDPAMAALAGWWLGGTIDEINQQRGRLSPSQQREFDRQVEQALRRQDRSFRKDISLEKLQYFFKTKPINPGSAAPPKAGLTWDPTSHRWVNPKTRATGAVAARGGKKRVRGTGTGVGEKKVKAGRKLAEGRKHRGAADIGEKTKKFKLPKIQ